MQRFIDQKQDVDALLFMDEAQLAISLPGLITRFPASGTWPERVRVGAAFIGLATTTPPGDPVVLVAGDGWLKVNDFCVACIEHSVASERIDVPLAADLLTMLRLRHRHADEAIEQSGLKRIFDDASEQYAEKMNEAAKILAPLGITRADLEAAFQRVLNRGAKDDEGGSR